MNIQQYISEQLLNAIGCAVSVETPRNREHGDFATNVAMQMARTAGRAPRAIADEILPKIAALPFVADASVAGPGFINIRLRDDFLINSLNDISCGPTTPRPRGLTLDLDYGAYNVAKSLHIGHLRTSIVGDTFNRIARHLGYKTFSWNHIGDWGKPMGLVIAWIIRKYPDTWDAPDFTIDGNELNTFYPAASGFAKENPDFERTAQQIKADFQAGDPRYRALYEKFMGISLQMMNDIVRQLNILPFDYNLGEANAAKYLDVVEKILRDKNLLRIDDGAEIMDLKTDSDNAPMPPFMWRDSRGADTYDTTDLAAVYCRRETDHPDAMIYFTDARQNLHFEQLFRAAELSGIYPRDKMEHIGYGTINGADGRPFKTRDGGVASLSDIIEIVRDAARARVAESGKNLPTATINMIALAALKFNDLMHDVRADYAFDPAAVTSFEGKTGPYILYTAVRLKSVLRRAGATVTNGQTESLSPSELGSAESLPPSGGVGAQVCGPVGGNLVCDALSYDERNLLLAILDMDRVIGVAFDKRAPDILANYTFDVAQLANTFYHNCPILRDDVAGSDRARRIWIAHYALDTLSKCTDLMGIQIPQEM